MITQEKSIEAHIFLGYSLELVNKPVCIIEPRKVSGLIGVQQPKPEWAQNIAGHSRRNPYHLGYSTPGIQKIKRLCLQESNDKKHVPKHLISVFLDGSKPQSYQNLDQKNKNKESKVDCAEDKLPCQSIIINLNQFQFETAVPAIRFMGLDS